MNVADAEDGEPGRRYKWQERRNRKYRHSKDRPTKEFRAIVVARDGHACRICRRSLSTDEITLDHVVEKKNGGQPTVDNLRVTCKPCNNRRSNPRGLPFKVKGMLKRLETWARLEAQVRPGGLSPIR